MSFISYSRKGCETYGSVSSNRSPPLLSPGNQRRVPEREKRKRAASLIHMIKTHNH